MSDVPERTPLSAAEIICGDLGALHRKRRAHFRPALLLSVVVVVAPFIALGVRPDLLELPGPQLAVQVLLWGVCLLVFPAIGVGLLFPGRAARLGLAAAAIALSLIAATGWPFSADAAHLHGSASFGCLPVTLGIGVALLGVGVISGAFVERRNVSGVFWVAAGLSLVALNVVTWHCPQSGMLHVVPSHLGGAAMLLALAVLVGVVVRRRHDAD